MPRPRLWAARASCAGLRASAKGKTRATQVANGYLNTDSGAGMSDYGGLERFLRTDPRDVGCAQPVAKLRIDIEAVLGPWAVDFEGLLASAGAR